MSQIDWSKYSEEEKEAIRLVMKNFAKMLSGDAENCLHCQQPITKLEQLGRCVYARPCGCRQYQGRLPKKGSK